MRVARQIQIGMRPRQVEAIIFASIPPKSSPYFAVPTGLGSASGDRSNMAYRLNREFVMVVNYEYPHRKAQFWSDEDARVIGPAKVRRDPLAPPPNTSTTSLRTTPGP